MVQELEPDAELETFIGRLPKAELHIHVEGTLEPELMMALAARNGVALPYADATAAAAARARFANLDDFLSLYYAGTSVLLTRRDFYDLADAYFARAATEGVRHAELFFDPQAHTARGVPWSEFFPGLHQAVLDALAKHGVSAGLIMCFLRHLGPEAAAETLEQALPYRDAICGVGLDSSEVGFPPALFAAVFQRAAELGWRRVAHAGEEAGPEYIRSALQDLGVERIDHGIHCLDDPQLVAQLEANAGPALTLCPLSNLRLQVYSGCLEAKLRQLVCETRVPVTVNSDDPAYFGGYVCANYAYLAQVAGLDAPQLAALAANSFRASFLLDAAAKERHCADVAVALREWQAGAAAGAKSEAEAGVAVATAAAAAAL
ncbi:adenosine deaminase [Chlorella sorokiniana]|uniref:Adenosine deaminase n=1 Tax=Chlorella sorokiniana TaxID=3076 RepID=A0A2P6U1B4_CHLSO|nr:adenosine deaminase [Chlorella sorokiniana]|eukprot:PRW60100.1 adenosine deaminase [Chlorella sorokiniana]